MSHLKAPDSCRGKIHYSTQKEARLALRRALASGGRYQVYRCVHGGWCVGHKIRRLRPSFS